MEECKRKAIPKWLKIQVWETKIGKQYSSKCFWCKRQEITPFRFHCGHIVSKKNGGKATLENLIPLCAECNTSINSKDMIPLGVECGISFSPNDPAFLASFRDLSVQDKPIPPSASPEPISIPALQPPIPAPIEKQERDKASQTQRCKAYLNQKKRYCANNALVNQLYCRFHQK